MALWYSVGSSLNRQRTRSADHHCSVITSLDRGRCTAKTVSLCTTECRRTHRLGHRCWPTGFRVRHVLQYALPDANERPRRCNGFPAVDGGDVHRDDGSITEVVDGVQLKLSTKDNPGGAQAGW